MKRLTATSFLSSISGLAFQVSPLLLTPSQSALSAV